MAAVLILTGSLLVSGGAGLVYRPAGLIVAGVLALWFGVDLTRDVTPDRQRRSKERPQRSAPERGGYPGGAGGTVRRPRGPGMAVVGDSS